MEKKYEDIETNFWKPEKKDDFVAGIYQTRKKNVGENDSDVYVLRQEDQSLIYVWDSTVLASKMEDVNIGDDIKIIYLGEEEGKKKYHNYNVQRVKTLGEGASNEETQE